MVNVRPTSETNTIHVRSEQIGSVIGVKDVVYYYNLTKEQATIATTAAATAATKASEASTFASNASLSATNAATSETNADNYANISYVWAEGDDEEVEELGGVHSAKGWANYVVNNAPEATVEETETGAIITTKDLTHGEVSVEIFNGTDGETGVGIESIEKTSTSGLVDTYTITYTDENTTTFNVTNGADGQKGADGEDGSDGFSPIANVVKVGNKATITITDETGTTTAEIFDGTSGASSFSDLTGSPYDNANLSTVLNNKQDKLTSGSGIDIADNIINNTRFYRGGIEPTNPDTYIWIEYGLTPEQIQALLDMTVEINSNGELIMNYDNEVLDFTFEIVGKNLIVNNNMEDLTFSIVNNNLEATYV